MNLISFQSFSANSTKQLQSRDPFRNPLPVFSCTEHYPRWFWSCWQFSSCL